MAHVLKTPREVANALRSVLGNYAHHTGAKLADPFSSLRFLGADEADAPVAVPQTWLLKAGWRRQRAGTGTATA